MSIGYNIPMEKITTTSDRPPNYPVYCALFLERTKGLDEWIAQRNMAAAALSRNATNDVKEIVVKSTISHLLNLAAGLKNPIKNLAFTAFLPESLRAGFKEASVIREAEERIKFLLPQIGEDRVAMLLPQELRTPQALAYMQNNKHFVLRNAITVSLQPSITHQPLTLE